MCGHLWSSVEASETTLALPDRWLPTQIASYTVTYHIDNLHVVHRIAYAMGNRCEQMTNAAGLMTAAFVC